MANTVGGDKVGVTNYTSDPGLVLPAAVPAANTTFYDGQAVGRNASGNMVQMDDTAKAEFIGILKKVKRVTVLSTWTGPTVNGICGPQDEQFDITRPPYFLALIATLGSVGGQEGQKVFWLYNNQVSLTPGVSANYAGTIVHVKDSTHVLVAAPWTGAFLGEGNRGIFTANAGAATTLTKWDVNKVVNLPLTSSQVVNLPAASTTSPGDSITFLNTGSASGVATLTPNGSDTINGGSSVAMSGVQYATLTVRSDGVSKWYSAAQNVSGTLGATTFTGAIGVSGAVTVTDAAAGALAVGPNGATNPALSVDGSVSSAATGWNIQGKAAGNGALLQVISSTGGEAGTISGGAATASTAGGAVTIVGAAGGSSSGAGGAVAITGGAGTAGNSAGGAVTITGGAGSATNAAGGAAALIGGLGVGSSAGGAITITSGAAGATGVAGAVNISVGGATAGAGSSVTITGGNGAGSTNAGGQINLIPGTAVSTGVPGEVQVNSVAGLFDTNWQQFLAANVPVSGTSYGMFMANRAYRVKAVSVTCSSTGTVPTVDVIKDTGTTAPGGGTSVLTGAISFNTTANTRVTGTVSSTVATITMAAGDRLSLKWGGTVGSITGAMVTVTLVPC